MKMYDSSFGKLMIFIYMIYTSFFIKLFNYHLKGKRASLFCLSALIIVGWYTALMCITYRETNRTSGLMQAFIKCDNMIPNRSECSIISQGVCVALALESASKLGLQMRLHPHCKFRGKYWARNYYLIWDAGNWVINLRFVQPQKTGERNFFHPVSRNPWEVIILGPVV